MSAGARAIAGAVVWIAFAWTRVPSWLHSEWAGALVAFAALVIAPLLLEILESARSGSRLAGAETLLRWAMRLQFPAALLLVPAFRLWPGVPAALCAMPWAGVLLLIAATGVLGLLRDKERSASGICRNTGLVFAAVGAAWLMADRLGIRPLGFDPEIVLLTAVHFHYAGLVLPVLAAEALERLERPRIAAAIVGGVVAGVPAVAVGITLAQLGVGRGVETGAAVLMAASGAAVAIVHLVLGLQLRWPVARRCAWIVAGCSLAVGMALAALYGVRGVWAPWPWLDVPWMRALHGSVNALGFAFIGTLGWWHVRLGARAGGPHV